MESVERSVRLIHRSRQAVTPRSWRHICAGQPAWTRRASLQFQTRNDPHCERRESRRAAQCRLRLAIPPIRRRSEALPCSPQRDHRRRRRRPNARGRRLVVRVSSSWGPPAFRELRAGAPSPAQGGKEIPNRARGLHQQPADSRAFDRRIEIRRFGRASLRPSDRTVFVASPTNSTCSRSRQPD